MSKWRQTEDPTYSNCNVGEYRRRVGAFDIIVGSAGSRDLFVSVEVRKSAHEVVVGWVKYTSPPTKAVIEKAKRKAEAIARKAGLAVPK